MQRIDLASYCPKPGEITEWVPTGEIHGTLSSSPPSWNQEAHVLAYEAASNLGITVSTWLAVRWDMPGKLDEKAFSSAVSAWAMRHDTLRSWFQFKDGLVSRYTTDGNTRFIPRKKEAPAGMREALESVFVTRTDPRAWPSWRIVTVDHGDSATAYFAADHTHIDGYSLLLVPADMSELYAAALQVRAPELPASGSHLSYSAAERAESLVITSQDPRMARWQDFLDACGGSPAFPLDVGTEGEIAPQKAFLGRLISEKGAARLDAVCRAYHVTAQAAVLAALAISARELSGCDYYRAVLPWHTRTEKTMEALGWFVGPVPLEIPTAGDCLKVAAAAQAAMRAGRSCRFIPWTRMTELLGTNYRPSTMEPFTMVSYLDARVARGSSRWGEQNAAVIGKAYHGDQVYLWVNRTADGISVAWRYPDHPVADTSVIKFTYNASLVLAEMAEMNK